MCGRKNKWTNTDLGQLQAQEREFVTLCILSASVDYHRRVFCAKLLQKLQGMPTHLWLSFLTASLYWPPFPWSAISRRLVSSTLRCRLYLSVFLCQLTLCVFSGTFLSSSTSGLGRGLELRPFVWVLRQSRQRDYLTGAQAYIQNNECPHSVTSRFDLEIPLKLLINLSKNHQ